VDTTDPYSHLLLYRKAFASGEVVLGGNEGKDTHAMYLVIITGPQKASTRSQQQ
jgi:hypothetical protein